MADKGNWSVCAQKPNEILYVDGGPMPGPLVVYRVHNNGPCAVTVGAAFLDPGTDCDVSGSRIEISLAGLSVCGRRLAGDDALGTYDLVCCQPPPKG